MQDKANKESGLHKDIKTLNYHILEAAPFWVTNTSSASGM